MMLGQNIRTLRYQMGLTQEQVAVRLGVSCQAVSKWETAVNTPDISLLPAIAKLLGVTIDALFSADATNAQEALLPMEEDDVIRIVQMQGRRVLAVTPRPSAASLPIEIAFPRNCNDHTQYFKVEVYGHVMADGSINGDVVCHQNIDCAQINGDVCANGDVKVKELNACGNVICHQIQECYRLSADRIECSGDIQANYLDCNQIVHKESTQ
ncbi:MAG: helix-turn-helix domain-containing protein [Clostridiales bacterium]|nr:helix-turn-helix domain-containing protein [Clostridiales bacterium]